MASDAPAPVAPPPGDDSGEETETYEAMQEDPGVITALQAHVAAQQAQIRELQQEVRRLRRLRRLQDELRVPGRYWGEAR